MTSGVPSSAAIRSGSSSGTWPSSGTPSSSASACPPPSPNGRRDLAAARADQVAHVLDDRGHPHAGLARHLGGAHRHLLGGRLRRGHQHQVGLGQQLAERDRDVAGARRHVHDQVVELAPVDVGEELLERAVEHRSAPDDGGVGVGEEPDRHHLQLVVDRRHDHLVDHHRLAARRPACGGSSSRRCRRRSRPPRRRRRPARPPGSPSASTCRRRPCRTRRRPRGCAGAARSAARRRCPAARRRAGACAAPRAARASSRRSAPRPTRRRRRRRRGGAPDPRGSTSSGSRRRSARGRP